MDAPTVDADRRVTETVAGRPHEARLAVELVSEGGLVLLVAAAVAASRVALGVHFPHDVIDGSLLGTLAVATATLLLRAPTGRVVERLAPRPIVGRLLLARPD